MDEPIDVPDGCEVALAVVEDGDDLVDEAQGSSPLKAAPAFRDESASCRGRCIMGYLTRILP